MERERRLNDWGEKSGPVMAWKWDTCFSRRVWFPSGAGGGGSQAGSAPPGQSCIDPLQMGHLQLRPNGAQDYPRWWKIKSADPSQSASLWVTLTVTAGGQEGGRRRGEGGAGSSAGRGFHLSCAAVAAAGFTGLWVSSRDKVHILSVHYGPRW